MKMRKQTATIMKMMKKRAVTARVAKTGGQAVNARKKGWGLR